MYFTLSVHYLPFIIAALLCLVIMYYAWQYRRFPIGKSMFILAAASCWWALGAVMEYGFNTLAIKQTWACLEYFGIETVPIAWLITVAILTENRKWINTRRILILSIVPIITIILMFTNSYHGLMRSNMVLDTNGLFSIIRKDYGLWFWVAAGYNYMLMIAATIILLQNLVKQDSGDRIKIILLILIAFLPWIGNTIFIFKLIPGLRIDLSAFALSISGILMAFSILRFQLMGVVPIARKFVIEDLADPILVIDSMNRILDCNRSCRDLFNIDKLKLAKSLEDNLEPLKELLPQIGVVESFRQEIELPDDSKMKIYDLRVDTIYNKWQKCQGRIFHFYDITDLKAAEKEREKVIAELRDALDKVETLSGFLPMCSNCKKIRDDQGYWNDVESYISKHSKAQFSHSLCDECMQKLYPEESERLRKKRENK